MNASDEHDKVARWLDGLDEALSPAQRRLADEVAQDERAVGPLLDVPVPPGALMRVHARLAGTLRLPRRAIRVGAWAGLAAAAAAVVLAAWLILPQGTAPPGQQARRQSISPAEYVSLLLQVPEYDFHLRAQMLREEISNVQMELALADDWEMEMELAGLENQMSAVMQEEAIEPFDWQE